MFNKYPSKDAPAYYIYDTATQKFLGANFEWNSHGVRVASIDEVKKKLRVIAERTEEATRPKNWDKIPHRYDDLPAMSFIPEYIMVTDRDKTPTIRARDLASQFLIQVWQKKATN